MTHQADLLHLGTGSGMLVSILPNISQTFTAVNALTFSMVKADRNQCKGAGHVKEAEQQDSLLSNHARVQTLTVQLWQQHSYPVQFFALHMVFAMRCFGSLMQAVLGLTLVPVSENLIGVSVTSQVLHKGKNRPIGRLRLQCQVQILLSLQVILCQHQGLGSPEQGLHISWILL